MNPEMLLWIEKKKPELVQLAENYVDTTKLYEANKKSKNGDKSAKGKQTKAKVSGSQLRNLLSAAQAGSSLAVLMNFLRYQIGRESQGWAHKRSGEDLLDLLTLLKGQIAKLCEEGARNSSGDRLELEAHLAAQLMGFIIRHYTYRCSLEKTRP